MHQAPVMQCTGWLALWGLIRAIETRRKRHYAAAILGTTLGVFCTAIRWTPNSEDELSLAKAADNLRNRQDEISSLIADKHMSPDAAAATWGKTHPEIWSTWLPGHTQLPSA